MQGTLSLQNALCAGGETQLARPGDKAPVLAVAVATSHGIVTVAHGEGLSLLFPFLRRGKERLREIKSGAQSHTVGKWRSWDWIPAHWGCGAHALGVLDPGAFLLPSCPGEGMERQEVPSPRMCLVRKGGGRTAWPPGSRKKEVQRTGGTHVSWGLWVTSLGSPARLSSGESGARARVTAWGFILLPSR